MKHHRLLKHLPMIFLLGIIALVFSSCKNDDNQTTERKAKQFTEKNLQEKYPGYKGVDTDYKHAGNEAIERWKDWKFGLRIHWGLYCMVGGHESWVLTKAKTKEFKDYYGTLWQFFDPEQFNPNDWVKMMEDGGIKYFTFTTKHHEGFCMWDTKTKQKTLRMVDGFGVYDTVDINYSIMDTRYKHDIVKELVNAGRKAGLGIGLYYSHIDWHDPAFAWDSNNVHYDPNFTKKTDPKRWRKFIDQEREQLTELMTNYGKIDLLSLDIAWPKAAQQDAYDVAKMVRKLQPNVLMRHRGIGAYGDYSTPEGEIPLDPNEARLNKPWQVIYPDGQAFSYLPNDDYKPGSWILHSLIDIVAKGGNFQVGFGPMPNGKWDPPVIERLKYVGKWLKVNGDAIYKTRPYHRYKEGENTRFTRSKDWKTVYAIALSWPGKEYKLSFVQPVEGSSIRMLGYDKDLQWTQNNDTLTIELPDELQNPGNRPCVQAYAFKIHDKIMDFSQTPEISLSSNTITTKPVAVTITAPEEGSEIRYTLDGSIPTRTSKLYTGPFEVSKTTIINAKNFTENKLVGNAARVSVASSENGVNFKYYEGKWLSVPDYSKLRPVKSGTMRNFNIDYHRREDHWGYEFTGYIKINKADNYSFYTKSDDGSMLYIDGKLVVNNDGSHSAIEKTGQIELSPGMHSIRVDYFEDYSGQSLDVLYSSRHMEKMKIPTAVLYRKKS